MTFYSRMQQTANRLLVGKGQAVTITHSSVGTYNPSTGSAAITTSTQYGYGAVSEWSARQIDGTLIKAGDRRLLLSPLNSSGVALNAPVIGDTITDSLGAVFTLVDPLKIMAPAGTVVLFDCNMRS